MYIRKKLNKSGSTTIQIICKELEKRLKVAGNPLSVKKACETVRNIYQIEYILPDTKEIKAKNLKMDDDQELLCLIVR